MLALEGTKNSKSNRNKKPLNQNKVRDGHDIRQLQSVDDESFIIDHDEKSKL